ncbi:MAG: nitroreductase family protein [Candidatus Omnitrophica bacterium]|nr:nitroreductase family protein [Candidatus Omnitrophota bacterium]
MKKFGINWLKNNTLSSIKNRHSVRIFLDKPVDDEDLKTILNAANQAPSAHNQQSWRFIVIRGEKKSDLANLICAKAGTFSKPSSTLLRLASRSIASAPVVVAVANSGELISRGPELFKVDKNKSAAHDFFRIMEIQSSAAAVQNLLIAATSLGLATVWLGVLVLIKNDILKFLGEPEGEFMAVVPVGYAAKPSGNGPQKQPLNMVVKTL